MKYILLLLLTASIISCTAQQPFLSNADGSVTLKPSRVDSTAVVITKEGNVGIGKKMPTDKLEVNGQIHARSVKVDLHQWADDVFKENYQLMRLREIAAYINKHGHLPDVPSEEEVLEKGINLGTMDAILLKKIEELTLHLIQKDKEIKRLSERLKTLENSLKN